MKDEDFVSKTINEGSVNLEKFPASRVCQHVKKMESSYSKTYYAGSALPSSGTNQAPVTSAHRTPSWET